MLPTLPDPNHAHTFFLATLPEFIAIFIITILFSGYYDSRCSLSSIQTHVL